MTRLTRASSVLASTAFAILFTASGFAQNTNRYLITNNDDSQGTSASFYPMGSGGQLGAPTVVKTGGLGWDGLGSVATNKIAVTKDANGNCAFISEFVTAGSASIPAVGAILIPKLKTVGNFQAASTDQVSNLNEAVTATEGYVYADFSQSQTIGTYTRSPGCQLAFVQDVPAKGITGASAIAMKAHGNILVVTYEDNSIESFNISGGVPVANGDLQYSTGYTQDSYDPVGVDITADGHYAIFGDGDPSNTPAAEVSDISSGKLTPTVVYSSLGSGSAGLAIWLSPDETRLYMSEFSTGQINQAFFDKTTGGLTPGCTSPVLKGEGNLWSFTAGLATASPFGGGAVLYVAEPDSYIGEVRVASGDSCNPEELPGSPVVDRHTITVESIGVFPPRPF